MHQVRPLVGHRSCVRQQTSKARIGLTPKPSFMHSRLTASRFWLVLDRLPIMEPAHSASETCILKLSTLRQVCKVCQHIRAAVFALSTGADETSPTATQLGGSSVGFCAEARPQFAGFLSRLRGPGSSYRPRTSHSACGKSAGFPSPPT